MVRERGLPLLRKFVCVVFVSLVGTSMAFGADWRLAALRDMRVAASPQLIAEAELGAYRGAGFNTMVTFDAGGMNDAGTSWTFKSEDEIRSETSFARAHGLPLILGMAIESYTAAASKTLQQFVTTSAVVANGTIPPATDDFIRERIALWKKYGDDVVIGVFPWYDDVFWQTVGVTRQRHVYEIIKEIAPDFYVFGMIGEFGFNATDEDLALYYDPAAFDHLIVLMYPFNVGSWVTGFPLDNVASSDPEGDLTRYIDRLITRLNERFFSRLTKGQLIVLVVQAFYYTGEPVGHVPRGNDIEIMVHRGGERIRAIAGQEWNHSMAYFSWGAKGAEPVGMTQRPDWRTAAADVNDQLERETRVLMP